MARYDLGLSWEEFEELTPGMFQALCKRRNIRIKYERYAHALTASAVYNTNRTKVEDPIVRPFDFVMTDEQATERERLMSMRTFIQNAVRSVPATEPRSAFLEKRRKVIDMLVQQGHMEAESLFNQQWPSLKPLEGEE